MRLMKYFPAVFLLCIFFTISIFSSLRESLTYDEIVHIQEGKNALLYHTFTIDTNNPPFERELAAIPLVLHIDTLMHSTVPNIRIFPARLMVIFLSVILGIGIFSIAYEYFGLLSAYLALMLYVFDPNTLGNNHYVTFDIGFALFFFLAYFLLIKTIENPTVKNVILLGICIGLGMSSKISFIPFYTLSAASLLIFLKKREIGVFIWAKKRLFLLALFTSFAVLWGTYFFKSDVIIAKRADATRVSSRITAYAKAHHNSLLLTLIHIGEHQPVPLGNYLAMIKNNSIRNSQKNTYIFLGGDYKRHYWYFMLINVLMKTPLVFLILFLIGLWNLRKEKKLPMFLFPLVIIIFVTSISNLAPWVRYVLPIYPFMSIVAGGSIALGNRLFGKCFLFALLCWYVFATLQFYPHFISYTNELISINSKKELLFIDSNMDWGQSIPDMAAFAEKENPHIIRFSYFGRDRADLYGLKSTTPYGSYKFNDICTFHQIPWNKEGKSVTAISISNWYYCGFLHKKEYNTNNIKAIVGHSILIF